MLEIEYWKYNLLFLTLCAQPTILEGLRFAVDLLLSNVILRSLLQLFNFQDNVKHLLSVLFGVFLLYRSVGLDILWTIALSLSAYFLLLLCAMFFQAKRGIIPSTFVIAFLIFSELCYFNPVMWQKIRGVQMVAAMKIVSVSIDVDRNLLNKLPNIVSYLGYILCPANCILGPWVPFQFYSEGIAFKHLKSKWLILILLKSFLSILCLLLSNCIVPWYISDESNKWLIAYKSAQAFRFSHYFISFLSQATMISAFGMSNDSKKELEVTKPSFIELPRSLVQVVVFWNMPMHAFLKNYIFKVCLAYGHFFAILITYAISSLLHGLNFQLSAVLLSIGTFSYVEYKLRAKIASIFGMCVLVNPCGKNCNHVNKGNSLAARITNLFFSFLTIIHLAYLGVMFEASFALQESGYSYQHTLSKWEDLNYGSHIIVTMSYLLYLIL